jgi:hypothetical protein
MQLVAAVTSLLAASGFPVQAPTMLVTDVLPLSRRGESLG